MLVAHALDDAKPAYQGQGVLMRFAMVEKSPGAYDIMLVNASTRTGLRGLWFPLLTPAHARLEDIVHVGWTGDGGDEPMAVAQFCPTWLANRMINAGFQETHARYRRANPAGGAIDVGSRVFSKQSKWGTVIAKSGKKKWVVCFDSGSSGIKNESSLHLENPTKQVGMSEKSRAKRSTQRTRLNKAAGGSISRWSVLAPGWQFGYADVRLFLEHHRKTITKQTVFWCMLFAALTANEDTKSAEKNMNGLTPVIQRKLAKGESLSSSMLTEDELARVWKSGLQDVKYKQSRGVLDSIDEVWEAISTYGAKDRALRDIFALQIGIPGGLRTVKFTFALEAMGNDLACLDRWMIRGLGLAEKVGGSYYPPGGRTPRNRDAPAKAAIECYMTAQARRAVAAGGSLKTTAPFLPFSEEAYILSDYYQDRFSCMTAQRTVQLPCLREYEWWEDKLSLTPYYAAAVEAGAPNPLARSQWTFWEDVKRWVPVKGAGKMRATHEPLFVAAWGQQVYDLVSAGMPVEVAVLLVQGRGSPGKRAKVLPLRR